MNKGSVLDWFGYHVQSTRIGIDDRSGYDAEFRERGHAGAPLYRPWHGGDSSRRIDKTHVPKWLRVDARIVVCIKRINAVMLCGHIDHVMRSAARYGNIRQVQRLPHHDPVDTLRKQFSKIVLVNIGWRKQGLVRIDSSSGVVVVIGPHGDLSFGRARQDKSHHGDQSG